MMFFASVQLISWVI